MLRSTLAAFLSLALAPLASGQTVLYSTDFSDGSGWTGLFASGCAWDTDAIPASVGGGFRSAPNSLNCNNDGGGLGYEHCYDRNADSPPIDLSAASLGATLSFWCAHHLEDNGCVYDTRHVIISNDGFATELLDLCYLWEDCGGAGVSSWHEHQVPLDPAWGTIQVRFHFDVGDDLFSNFTQDGWYVDDVVVTSDCPPSVPYCTAKVNSQGCTPTIFSTGTPSFSGAGNAFRVQASGVLNQHPGILIWSLAGAANPFGGGTLCLASPVNRTPGQLSGGSGSGSDCTGSYSYQFTPAFLAANTLNPGTAVFTQYWSRDTGFSAPDNIGLTAGMRFAVCD